MTEAEARLYRSELDRQETELEVQRFMAESALSLTRGYERLFVTPGWAGAVKYTGWTVAGLAVMATAAAAPVSIVGFATYTVGVTLASYGLAGAGAYTSQLYARALPGTPGAAASANNGEWFEQTYLPKAPSLGGPPAADRVLDLALGKAIDKTISAASRTSPPGLPDKADVDAVKDYFESTLKWVNEQLEHLRARRDGPDPERAAGRPSRHKRSAPTIRAPTKQDRLELGPSGQHGQPELILDAHPERPSGGRGYDAYTGPDQPHTGNLA